MDCFASGAATSRRARRAFRFEFETVARTGSPAAGAWGSDTAKPMKGLGSGVFEIALPHRGNAFRVVYAVQLGEDLWVVHAFQKKSTQGIKTPQREIDAIRDRLKRLQEMFR
jgi:phage-related protein